ncbi:ribbon-helix-helix domain-containing protein [Methylomagnum sp.]
MHKTTLYFDDDIAQSLRERANAEGRGQMEIIRDAILSYLRQPDEREVKPGLPPGVGVYRSGRSDVSAQAENILRAAARQPK